MNVYASKGNDLWLKLGRITAAVARVPVPAAVWMKIWRPITK